MKKEDIENLLAEGRDESSCFFSRVDYKTAREEVFLRAARKSAKKPKPVWPFALKALLAAASVLIAAGVFAVLVFSASGSDNASAAKPLSQQELHLDRGKGALLSYFPVETPNENRSGLMSVLWDTSSVRSDILYSTVFKECNVTYPASSLEFPDTGRSLALIFSGSSIGGFIDYRIIGYDNDSIIEWWYRDYVTGGRLSVKDGVVREEKGAPDDGRFEPYVTYIIPYDIQVSGDIVLPVRELELKTGEQILLVGVSAHPITVSSQSGLIKKVEPEGGQSISEYQATAKGSDVLLLKGENITGSSLNINITE
jgi:hypothetical protein